MSGDRRMFNKSASFIFSPATIPGACLCAVSLRCPHAHARFQIDAAQALAMPGVKLVLTGVDISDLGFLPCSVALPNTVLDVPPSPVLARNEVRHVGDAIAFVVGETRERAKDAAEAITLTWEELPNVTDAAEALAPAAPRVWAEHRGNLVFDISLGDKEATERAFAEAVNVVSLTLVNQRVVANFLDTRGGVAAYNGADNWLTLTLW